MTRDCYPSAPPLPETAILTSGMDYGWWLAWRGNHLLPTCLLAMLRIALIPS